MANIRASIVVTSILAASLSAGSVSASLAPRDILAVATPQVSISASIILIPLKALERQTVSATDVIGPFNISKVVIDIATATDSVALTVDKQLTDSISATDLINKVFVANVDFDLSDPDVDPDPISISDSQTLSVGKNLTDVTAINETNVKNVGVNKSETLVVADEIFTIVGKNLDNSVSTSDELTKSVSVEKTDLVEATETHAITFTKGNISDDITSSDLASLNAGLNKISAISAEDTINSFDIGKNPSDNLAIVDTIDSVVVGKVLSDSVLLIDFVAKTYTEEVDFDRTDADIDPDPVSVADAAIMTFGSVQIDSVTPADTVTKAVQAVYANTVTVSDVIDILLTPGDSVPVYDFAFIADDKYTYFPVSGTFNGHQVHQPLLAGEFVLTTDPNAGIVYTIRPEAVSYTLGWYGINENQFN